MARPSTLLCGFTALKVSLINQGRQTRIRKDKDARLACEHRSMTSSTTELLDFIHIRPEDINKGSQESFLHMHFFLHFLETKRNSGQSAHVQKARGLANMCHLQRIREY